jgi:Uri superfamily endonuclease
MKGIYVLLLSINKSINVNVGALGVKHIEKGLYAYVGSAQKSLEKRVERHLKRKKRKFWHIDYLLDSEDVRIFKVFFMEVGKAEECKMSKMIGKYGISIKGFGSSDCKCESHLFRVGGYDFLRQHMKESAVKTL